MTNLTRKEFLLQELCKSKEDILEAISSSKIKSNVRLNELCHLISELTDELQEKNNDNILYHFPNCDYKEFSKILEEVICSVYIQKNNNVNIVENNIDICLFRHRGTQILTEKYIQYLNLIDKLILESVDQYTQQINGTITFKEFINKISKKYLKENTAKTKNELQKEIDEYIRSLDFNLTRPILLNKLTKNLLSTKPKYLGIDIERNRVVNTEKKLLLFPEWDYEEAKVIVTDIVNSVELLGDIWLNESLKCVTVRIFAFDSIPKVPGKYSILFIDTITKSIEKYTEKINVQSPKSLEYRLNKNYTKMVLEHNSDYCNSRLKEIYEDYIKSLNFAKTKPILIETLLENLLAEAK